MRVKIFTICLSFLFLSLLKAQESVYPLQAKNYSHQQKWVDSIYYSMSLKEKIGQLFMIQVFSNQNKKKKANVVKLIKDHYIGGVIYSKGGPVRQVKLNNELQAVSKIPLLIGMDAEWGLSMRLDSTYAFPWNMTLGAIKNLDLIRQTGKHIGEHCRRLGVHFNFAPVVDINTNSNNPIIGNRSFGEDRDNVTQKSLALMEGLQSVGVLANAKHFPGHGDTNSDSHKTLPTINFSKKRIDSVELHPYKTLINKGLSSIMVAHLNVPSLEPTYGLPSSLSSQIVTKQLKENLKFKGLIFTDALNMKGVSEFNESGQIDLQAFMAGNDVLLISENTSAGISKILEAYKKGVITEARLSHSVKKILMAKYKVGLHHYKPIGTYNLVHDLNRLKDDVLYEQLVENAITVVKNKSNLLPIQYLENKNMAYVKLGNDNGDTFYNELKKYTKVDEIKADNLDVLLQKLNNYNTVVVGFHKSNNNPWKSYKFTDKELVWLYEIARTNTVILSIFTKPYSLLDLKTTTNVESIVVAYQNSNIAQQKTAQLLFGAIDAKGYLPVSSGPDFKQGSSIKFSSIKRLSYGLPERVGMSSERLKHLDSVAQYAVNSSMTPGVQLLVARRGKVVYNKNFGKHTYKGKQKVKPSDIYDIASLTKIVATLPLLMELEEDGIVSLNSKLSNLLPEYKDSNKKDVSLIRMLSHYAKLKPWIPFYINTLDSITKEPLKSLYRTKSSDAFNIEVTNKLFLKSTYKDSIYKHINESELLSRLRYRYSDLPYYILKKYIEKHHNQSLDELVEQHLYKSLGANYTTYNPLKKFDKSQIVPSEIDDYYRYQEIDGYVHDMGAAMQNGVGGHAGIFSNANDIAKIMQMYLQKGYYGGKRYFEEKTIDKFNRCYFCENENRRGVGFDKPQLGEEGPTCGCISMTSFGHSGFTGTYTWADPEEEIVYVFMANRTYPKAGKNRLLRENIRTEIQRLIYEAIDN